MDFPQLTKLPKILLTYHMGSDVKEYTIHHNPIYVVNIIYYRFQPSVATIWHTKSQIPDQPWRPPSLLYNGYWLPFMLVKRLGRGVDHPPHLVPRLRKK
jgi:hypothetical protein